MSESVLARFGKDDPGTPAAIIDMMPEFKPGDPRPKGYAAFFEWAEVQGAAGLVQSQCLLCGRWHFPQESCCGRPMTPSPAPEIGATP